MENKQLLEKYDKTLEELLNEDIKLNLSFLEIIIFSQTIFDKMEEIQTKEDYNKDDKEYAFKIKLKAQKVIDNTIIDLLQD